MEWIPNGSEMPKKANIFDKPGQSISYFFLALPASFLHQGINR